MRYADLHREAMFAAADAHDALEFDVAGRIDVFGALRQVGVRVMVRPLRGVSGLYLPGTHGRPSGVLVSSLHPPARQRFTAAHELGHHWLGHTPSIDLHTEMLARGEGGPLEPNEIVAEAFASWFLMPVEAVERALEAIGTQAPRAAEDVYSVSLRLGTSYEATTYHLATLGFIDFGTARTWAKRPPLAAKEILSPWPIPAAKRDVWLLSMRDSGAAFHVCAGDRVVIALPDDGWRADSLPEHTQLIDDIEAGGRLFADPDVPRAFVFDVAAEAEGAMELCLQRAPSSSYTVRLDVEQPLLGIAA